MTAYIRSKDWSKIVGDITNWQTTVRSAKTQKARQRRFRTEHSRSSARNATDDMTALLWQKEASDKSDASCK